MRWNDGYWRSDFVPHRSGNYYGCNDTSTPNLESCSSVLQDDRRFTYKGTTFTVTQLHIHEAPGGTTLTVGISPNFPAGAGALRISARRDVNPHVDLSFTSDGSTSNFQWTNVTGLDWGRDRRFRPPLRFAKLLFFPKVSLSVSPNPAQEGEGWEEATVTATLDSPWNAGAGVVFRLTGTNGTAEDGDWGFSNPNIHIPRASYTGTTRILIPHDDDDEDETLTVALPNTLPCAGRFPKSCLRAGDTTSVQVTIDDDEAVQGLGAPEAPTVSLSAAPNPVAEGSQVMVTVKLSSVLSSAVTIPLTVTRGTSEEGDHGTLTSITIPAGGLSASGAIATNNDADADDETFTVELDAYNLPSEVAAAIPPPITVTITDDASGQQTSGTLMERCASYLPANAVSVSEVKGWRDAHSDAAHVLRWNRVLKALGEDVGAGVSAMTVAESKANESRFMRSRWARVTATLEAIQTCLAGGNGDPTVSLSAAPNPVAEGSGVRVTATLSSTLSSNVTVPLSLSHGTAEDGDYGSLSSITVLAGFSSATGTITTTDDGDADDETFTVALGTLPSGLAAGSPSTVTVTITDDDVVSGQGGPGSGGGKYAALIAKMYEWRNDPQWVHQKEHTDRWDRALLAFGETVADSSLTAMRAAEAQGYADRGWERWVEVAAAMWEIEGGRPAPVPVVTVSAGDAVTEGTAASFTLTAAPAPVADLAVTVTVSQQGAVADASALGERTVTIPAGTASAHFTVATVDDDADEADGYIGATLAAGDGYTVGDTKRASVKVADDEENNPGIVTKRGIARETDDAVVFSVRLDRQASHTVTVDYATADGAGVWAGSGTATAGTDYTATSGTLTFAAGETRKSVSVPILDDVIDEGTEYFLLRFSNAQGATLDDREVEGLIRNTDLIPGALLGRFGRATAEQVVTHIEERMAAPRQRGFRARFAGRELRSGQERDFALGFLTQFAQPMGMGSHAGAAPMGVGSHAAPLGMGPHAGGARRLRRERGRHDGHGRRGRRDRHDGHGRRRWRDGHEQYGRHAGCDGRLRAGGRRARRRPAGVDGDGRRPVLQLRVRAEPREPRRDAVGVEPQLPVLLQRPR